MNADGTADTVCWNCVKARHAICTGRVPEEGARITSAARLAGQIDPPCECPVCHANRYAKRAPVWDSQNRCYYDPGPTTEVSE